MELQLRLEHTSTTSRHNSRRESKEAQDISIPLQLFQATGHGGSVRDRGESLSWRPQPSLPYSTDGSLSDLARCMTHDSDVLAPVTSSLNRTRQSCTFQSEVIIRRNTSAQEEVNTTNPALSIIDESSGSDVQRRLSYEIGAEDVFSTTPRGSRPTTQHQITPAPSIWSTTDPFSTSKNSFTDEDAQTRPSSQTPDRALPSSLGDADNACETIARRGTIRSIVDAVIPNTVSQRFTNASHVRKGSIWQLYEQAKERGVSLQRHRTVQVAFEYGIYAILVLIIYFILIGVPLWNGAVYWLWWVVAHKFVIAGGFSITLGIALL
jgi:hypothetical protein